MYNVVTLEEVITEIDNQELLAYDTETDGLYGPICLAQFYQENWEKPLLVRKPNPYMLAAMLQDQPLIGHNIHYDISTLQDQLGTYWVPEEFTDTFYAARLQWPRKDAFSLDASLAYALGYDPYKKFSLNKKVLQNSDWTGLLTDDQLLYASLDVLYMFDLLNECKDAINSFSYKLDILFTKHCLKFQRIGLPVDNTKLQAQFAKNNAILDSMAMPINVNSWQQVRPYIGEEESDGLALARFTILGNKRAEAVNKARKLIKENSFLRKFDTLNGRIYGKFLPSARSGRCTSRDQNLQQLPRSTKGVFGVKEGSGKIFLYSDYAQLELRCACVITNEQRMENLFRAGEDLHSYTAEMLFGKDYTKKQRQIAKTCNFNLLYGGSAGMLGSILIKDAGIMLPDFELADIKRKWQRLWPAIVSWQRNGINAWRNGVVWKTPLGRAYKGKLMTDQLNIQIQGFGSEVSKLATHYMAEKLHPSVKIANFIHDSWILELDDDDTLIDETAHVLANAMQEAWQEASKAAKIKDLPMPVDVFAGYNWGDIENDNIPNKYELRVQ